MDDELVTFQKKGKSIGIIGTKGSLEEPTWWQARNIPNIRKLYRNKFKKIKELTTQFNTDLRILLFHYAPTYLTVIGEPKRSYPQMRTSIYEKVILNEKFKINIVFHGHAHRGRKFILLNNRIPVYNVAIPLTKKITIVDLPRSQIRGSILSYLK